MSSMTSGNASDFEFSAIRRGVVTIWFISTNDPAATLETGVQHDRGFGLSLIHISEPTRLSLVSRMPSSA